jgi:NADH-ubiquinone oxidoreductase chain 5
MEGPTPVSALLHAATMVTVGVFCLIRCNSLFNKTPVILIYIIIIGALTALFGSIVGLLQNDIKRVIAYSTCSQLGYMILACGLTHYEVALYHLTNHAFFKALLFLTAGGVIHSLNGKQDIREMGSLLKLQPVLYISFFIGSFALVGLPFFSGYYSKDFILEFAFVNYNNYASFGYLLALIGAFFTAFYSMRLIYLTFISSIKNVNKTNILNLHKLSNFIYFPLLILSLLSIFSGWVFKDLFIGFGTNTFEFNITHSFNFLLLNLNIELGHIFLKDEFLPLPNLITLVAIFMSYFFCKVHQNEDDNAGIISKLLNLQFRKINFLNSNNFFQKKLFFDYIYYCIFTKSTFFLSYNIFYKIIDRGLYEIIGPYGLTNKLFNHSIQINNLHSKQPF